MEKPSSNSAGLRISPAALVPGIVAARPPRFGAAQGKDHTSEFQNLVHRLFMTA